MRYTYVSRHGTMNQRFDGYIARRVVNPRRLVDDLEYVCEAPGTDAEGKALAERLNREAEQGQRWFTVLPVMAAVKQGVTA